MTKRIKTVAVLLGAFVQFYAIAQQPASEPTEAEKLAWNSAQRDATPAAYRDFYGKFPQSSYIKTMTATVRGRYWFKTKLPFANANEPNRDGVVVTVEGSTVFLNLSLEDAKRLKVIGTGPPAANVKAQATTFNYTYVEVTGGGYVVGNQTIVPLDNVGAIVILTADGTHLLGLDLTKATPASQPWPKPTMVEDSGGKYLCGAACP
jgi:hypothetical protein